MFSTSDRLVIPASRRNGLAPPCSWLLALAVMVASGCARQSYFQTHPAKSLVSLDRPGGVGVDARGLPMYAGVTQQPLDWAAVLDAVAWADVILIGEQHDDGMGHAVQLALAQDTLQRFPRSAISLEMLERDEQPLVDDYFDGIIDSATFIKLTDSKGWAGEGSWENWYQPIIDAAKTGGGRVVAANAPRRYVRLARREGYERLRAIPSPRRGLFDVPTTPVSDAYWKRFRDIMTESDPAVAAPSTSPSSQPERHGGSDDAGVRNGFRSQLVWDTTMATSIALAARGNTPKVVHLVGQFHTDFEGGTVQQLRKRLPGAKILTISMQRENGNTLREVDINRADIIIYTGERPAEPEPQPEPETQPAEIEPATTTPAVHPPATNPG